MGSHRKRAQTMQLGPRYSFFTYRILFLSSPARRVALLNPLLVSGTNHPASDILPENYNYCLEKSWVGIVNHLFNIVNYTYLASRQSRNYVSYTTRKQVVRPGRPHWDSCTPGHNNFRDRQHREEGGSQQDCDPIRVHPTSGPYT